MNPFLSLVSLKTVTLAAPDFNLPRGPSPWWLFWAALACLAAWGLFHAAPVLADVARLPGADASDKLEAAGTLLRLVDTALFKWGARIFAGICIMSAAWALKEQRFGIAIICIVGALIFGTSTTWVKNVFSISSSDSVFGLVMIPAFFRAWRGRHV